MNIYLSWQSMLPCQGLCTKAGADAKGLALLALQLFYACLKRPRKPKWNASAAIWVWLLHIFHKPQGPHSVLFPYWFWNLFELTGKRGESDREKKIAKKRRMQSFSLSQRIFFGKIFQLCTVYIQEKYDLMIVLWPLPRQEGNADKFFSLILEEYFASIQFKTTC